MKGKLFKPKPVPPKNDIILFFTAKKKPWKNIREKVYNWKSSIPEKWFSLKGNSFFRHSSDVKYPRLTIEILQNLPKYKDKFRVSSQESMRVSPILNETRRSSSPNNLENRRFSIPGKRGLVEKNFLITGEPRLSSILRTRISKEKEYITYPQISNKVEKFLRRFDRKPIITEHPMTNKGLLGWKLKQLKSTRNQAKKNNYTTLFNVKDHSHKPYNNINSKRSSSLA